MAAKQHFKNVAKHNFMFKLFRFLQNFQSISRNVRKIIINFPKIKKYFHNKIFYVVPIRQKSMGGGGGGGSIKGNWSWRACGEFSSPGRQVAGCSEWLTLDI